MLGYLPNFIIQRRILNPMRLATAGTVLAVELALQRGWAINLAGGYHHAKPDNGEGFCFFADIPLAVKKQLEKGLKRVLIVDLDAHQGNGYVTLFAQNLQTTAPDDLQYVKDSRVHIFDMYNSLIYPGDSFAKQFITYDHPLRNPSSAKYLKILFDNLPAALEASRPDLLFYNAGTDIFEGDALGQLQVTAQGIVDRDEFVFRQAKERGIPIAMVLSGGYTPESARIIADSISNLHDKGLISLTK